MNEFKVNDIVEWCGVRGKVIELNYGIINVEFPKDCLSGGDYRFYKFYKDGRFYEWHKEPSLILIDRPIKRPKVAVEFKDWEEGKTYMKVFSTVKYTKRDGLPYDLNDRMFSINSAQWFANNEFYEVE